ncbi:MAG: hypothetical protein ACRYFS_20470 [Janthinobacterium lividum]
MEYAFRTLKLPRLVGAAALENQRPVNLQKRLGYQVFRNPHASDDTIGDGIGLSQGWVTVLTNPLLSEVPIKAGAASNV